MKLDTQFKEYWELFKGLNYQNWAIFKKGGHVDIASSTTAIGPSLEERNHAMKAWDGSVSKIGVD